MPLFISAPSKQDRDEIIALGLFILGFAILILGLVTLLCIRNRGHPYPSPPDSAKTVTSYVFWVEWMGWKGTFTSYFN